MWWRVQNVGFSCACAGGAGSDAGPSGMEGEENGDVAGAGAEGTPVMMALPVRPQCMWTLDPAHACNIRGGQVQNPIPFKNPLQALLVPPAGGVCAALGPPAL